jgi:hypothetical protein
MFRRRDLKFHIAHPNAYGGYRQRGTDRGPTWAAPADSAHVRAFLVQAEPLVPRRLRFEIGERMTVGRCGAPPARRGRGLRGRSEAARGRNVVEGADPRRRHRGDTAVDVVDDDSARDVYVHRTAGGGGWGDPAERDPQRHADDLADGKVTR